MEHIKLITQYRSLPWVEELVSPVYLFVKESCPSPSICWYHSTEFPNPRERLNAAVGSNPLEGDRTSGVRERFLAAVGGGEWSEPEGCEGLNPAETPLVSCPRDAPTQYSCRLQPAVIRLNLRCA